jgi:hypothetical protein
MAYLFPSSSSLSGSMLHFFAALSMGVTWRVRTIRIALTIEGAYTCVCTYNHIAARNVRAHMIAYVMHVNIFIQSSTSFTHMITTICTKVVIFSSEIKARIGKTLLSAKYACNISLPCYDMYK